MNGYQNTWGNRNAENKNCRLKCIKQSYPLLYFSMRWQFWRGCIKKSSLPRLKSIRTSGRDSTSFLFSSEDFWNSLGLHLNVLSLYLTASRHYNRIFSNYITLCTGNVDSSLKMYTNILDTKKVVNVYNVAVTLQVSFSLSKKKKKNLHNIALCYNIF